MPAIGLTALLVLALPLLGAAAAGKPLAAYLQFPPTTPDVRHAPFSLPVFLALAALILATTVPFFARLHAARGEKASRRAAAPFPWWGWAGAVLCAGSWILAWSRFPWMGRLQAHTFTPLWISFILLVNAVTFRRTGRCLLLSRPRPFLLLFPVSAGFWWTFEYLNRFVGNWHYVGVDLFGPMEYFLFATLPFSTVLPAVASAGELIRSSARFDRAFRAWRPLSLSRPRAAAGAALSVSCMGLAAVGTVPDAAFLLVWLAPPTILLSLAALGGRPHALSGIASGDWRRFAASALGALLCGFFWEMWNYGSSPKWVYDVPYVDLAHLFEMPVLGYAGYLPFGILCLEIAGSITGETVEMPEKFRESARGD